MSNVEELELREQLAEVSAERDFANKRHNEVLLCFGMMRDERDELQLRLNASEARNAELEKLLRDYPGQTISIYEKASTVPELTSAEIDAFLNLGRAK